MTANPTIASDQKSLGNQGASIDDNVRGSAHSWIRCPLGVQFPKNPDPGKENIKGSWARIGAGLALSGGLSAMAVGACHGQNPPTLECPGLVALTTMVIAAADLPSNAGAGNAVADRACSRSGGLKV